MNKFLVLILTFLIGLPAFSQSSSGFGWQGRSGGGGLTSPVGISDGGTGQTSKAAAFNALSPLTTTGDIIYSSSGSTAARLGIGAYDKVLRASSSGVPEYADRPVAPSVSTSTLRRFWYAYTLASSAGISPGMSYSSAGTVTNAVASDGYWTNLATAASLNSDAAVALGTLPCRFDGLPRMWVKFKPVDTTGVRFALVLSPNAPLGSSNFGGNTIGLRFDSSVDVNGNIRFVTVDNSNGMTAVDTGVSYAASPFTVCFDYSQAGTVNCFLNGNLVGTSTTNLPSGSTSPQPYFGIRSLSGSAVNVKIGTAYGDNI